MDENSNQSIVSRGETLASQTENETIKSKETVQVTQSGMAQMDEAQVTIVEQPVEPMAGQPVGPTIEQPATDDSAESEKKPKKKHKGLIIGLVCALVVLLLGGGAFATFYMINNQPEKIIASAMGNLLNAKQLAVDGSFDVSANVGGMIGVKSVAVAFDSEMVGSSQATNVTLKVNLVDGTEIPVVDLGEVMMSDGVFYLKVDGLKELYYDNYYDMISQLIESSLQSNYKSELIYQCQSGGGDYYTCYNTVDVSSPEATQAIDVATTKVMGVISEIVDSVDDNWFEFSIEDILDSEMLGIGQMTRQGILATYNCTREKMNNFGQYTDEFGDLYNKNPFVMMTAGRDGFYDIDFNADALAEYASALDNTKLYGDLAECSGVSQGGYDVDISGEDVAKALTYFPDIQAKFDGVFDHHLTELKMNKDSEYYTLNADVKFAYPNNLVVTAPSNARPVMELVEEIVNKITTLSEMF
ncbi:hypothetical protein IJG04_00500 [Candidatus Saccharibacteria bacterium]|nr:hypothetical protein [Candidatus Saccharibacteria bacterium]